MKPDNKSLPVILSWLKNTLETYDINLGHYEASFDYSKQIATWHCMGCDAECYSHWPEWKLTFVHKPECMYMKLQELFDSYTDNGRP